MVSEVASPIWKPISSPCSLAGYLIFGGWSTASTMSDTAEKSLVALMFTDLVGSVALQQRLGTAAYMRYVGRHDEIFQQCLARVGDARVLNESGMGSWCASVTRATRCGWLWRCSSC
jgi:hypothetical protein